MIQQLVLAIPLQVMSVAVTPSLKHSNRQDHRPTFDARWPPGIDGGCHE
jgi:hypothetical protein